jgi:phosphohistidine phosphatase SixA
MNRRDALRTASTLPWLGLPLCPRAAPAEVAESAESAQRGDAALTARLRRGGGVALMLRHSITDPGVGDPPGFQLADCTTQRNLSAAGRAQAQRIGAWFEARGLRPAQVRSSAWCRCLDTGRLAFGRVEPWPALNSFFGDASARERQSAALRAALGSIGAGQFEVWVTHQVNVTPLTSEFAEMGEGCVIEPGAAAATPRVFGRWRVEG